MHTSDFDFDLPDTSIAQRAIEPRDSSRLLVTSNLTDRHVTDLPDLLDPRDLLVVNRTRVRAARLIGARVGTGGQIEALLTRRIDERRWEALLRPARRLRAGAQIDFGSIAGLVMTDPEHGLSIIELEAAADVDDILPGRGEVPLPPYFHGHLADPERYQTIFAKEVGSAAAPTAALHFTPELVDRLGERGVGFAEVDLHIGIDTFRPMGEGDLADHRIHSEWFEVGGPVVASVRAARRAGGKVVAVGTTVVRALETAAATGEIEAMSGRSSLFITPGYRSQVVDAIVTNFHAPRTTLLALVAAYLGPEWPSVYDHAVTSGYRFLSFGDAMLIDRPVNR